MGSTTWECNSTMTIGSEPQHVFWVSTCIEAESTVNQTMDSSLHGHARRLESDEDTDTQTRTHRCTTAFLPLL